MLCFKGRCYPAAGETASSVEYAKPKKDFFNEAQRGDLRRKMMDRYVKQFGKCNKEGIKQEIDQFFDNGAEVNSSSIYFLQQKLQKMFPKGDTDQPKRSSTVEVQAPRTKTPREIQPISDRRNEVAMSQPKVEYLESQVISEGETVNNQRTAQSQNDFRLPALSKQKMMERQPIAWKNDEEKWGTIYKYNAYIYKQEQKLERLRAQHKMQGMRNNLEEQVREKERQKQREKEQQLSFLTLNKQLKDLEKQNEGHKDQHKKAKAIYEREMRQRQIAENRAKRDREERVEKDIQALTTQKIKEELVQEKEEAEDLKQRRLEEMRRVMAENEDRKIIMAEIRERDRQEDVDLQRKAVEVGEELERQRIAEFKTKADRISNIIKRYFIPYE